MPLVAGGIGLIVVAALAAFALWPKSTPPGHDDGTDGRHTGRHAAPAASVAAPSAPTPTPVVATPRVGRTGRRRAGGLGSARHGDDGADHVAPARRRTPTEPARPTAAADPKPVVRKPPPPRETPAQPSERPAAPVQARPAEPKPTDNSAECARIFQQISLGQADQATMDRLPRTSLQMTRHGPFRG